MTYKQQHWRSGRENLSTPSAPRSPNIPVGTEPPLGAHLVTQRRGYEHHGIYVGDGKVVHYAGLAGRLHRGPVEEITVAQFGAGHDIWIRPSAFPKYAGQEAIRRARSRLGENRYRLLTNNCEHFCAWCLYGESRSEQVEVCLTHPRLAMRAAMSVLRAFFEAEWKGVHFGARTA